MRAVLRLAFITSLLVSTLASAQDIASCRRAYFAEKKGMPTAAIRGFSADYAACTKRAMNVEVDRVLVPLKKADAERFKTGMALQKTFNEAVQRYCGRWSPYYEKCCSTCSFNEQPECEADFYSARVALVRSELSKNALPEGSVTNDVVKREFSDFASAWCARNEDCTTRVLALISATQRDDGRALTCR